MKQVASYKYYKATPSQQPALIIESLAEFIQYTLQANTQNIFVVTHNGQQYFACLHQGVLIASHANHFNSLEDCQKSVYYNFPDAAAFYDAGDMGYTYYNDYKLVKEAGIGDIKTFEKIKEQGYIDGFAEFSQLKGIHAPLPGEAEIINPYGLYLFASKNSFGNFEQFKKAWQAGFTNCKTYEAAMEKGFKNAADYTAAMEKGFGTAEDYSSATELNIKDAADFQRYIDLAYARHDNQPHDCRVLLLVISQLPQGKKVSINKLTELFRQGLEVYRYTDGEMPLWFTTSLQSTEHITAFLCAYDEVKKFGQYDTEGEYFETKQLNQRKVVLDGSNVAHNSQGNDKSKPTVTNLLKVVNNLLQKGFEHITVISDASLKHRLLDKEKLAELETICEYKEAPAETAADTFLIQFVKHNNCLIVTNDTFREWKLKDKWVAENIDYYKLSFMIDGNKVLMPDIDSIN